MTTLSAGQIGLAATKAGVSGNQVAIAIAVALAESGGRTEAHNPKPPDDSYGLWQINMYGKLGPARKQQFGITTNEQLLDADVNARAMAVISNGGTNWRPWSTFTSGAYLKHMGVAQTGATQASTGQVPVSHSPTGEVWNNEVSDLGGITDLAGMLSDPKTWWRVAYILGGIVLMFMGFLSVMNHTKAGRAVVKTVKKVAG